MNEYHLTEKVFDDMEAGIIRARCYRHHSVTIDVHDAVVRTAVRECIRRVARDLVVFNHPTDNGKLHIYNLGDALDR